MLPETPFYYYDIELLKATLDAIASEVVQYPNYHIHYALKANSNPSLLALIQQAGLGADCVSGGEVQRAIDAGFSAGFPVALEVSATGLSAGFAAGFAAGF